MAQDPRNYTQFSVKSCPKNVNQRVVEDQKKSSFFSDLGKAGDIEVLNRFGGGKISAGMRDLSKISDSIRVGDTDSAIIPNSAGYVFETVGINPNAAEKAGEFNPGVLNRATGEAESIIDRVRSGNFKLEDVAGQVANIQNLSTLSDGIFTEETKPAQLDPLCDASPYAVDLMRYAPKHKFMFVVEVVMASAYKVAFKGNEEVLAFVVKSSTRPNIAIEHEEINMYNFWVKIPKRTVHEPITMKFYDDLNSFAHDFYREYLGHISPITRTGGTDQTPQLGVDWLQANSMNNNAPKSNSTASIGALSGNNKSIITEIRLYHLINYGREMTVYHFHHPKITNMNLDELDMAESGGGNEIEFQFVYDALHISETKKVKKTITDLTGGKIALYPIVPNPLSVASTNGTVDDDDDYDDDSSDDNGFGEPEEFDGETTYPSESQYDNSGTVTPIVPSGQGETVRQLNRDPVLENSPKSTTGSSWFGGTAVTRQDSPLTSQEFDYDP